MNSVSVRLDTERVSGAVTPNLFGSFIEHIGRSVYGGIYEPGHPRADENGFREDVLELVRELGVTKVRYPGGNFVSGFRWEDSVGPRSERPRRRELAWHSVETNEFGLHEMHAWTQKAGLELMYALNLGTRGVESAIDLLDYANGAAGTTLADRRAANGSAEPFGIKTWYLGNEMDGPWQVGHLSGEEYGRKASGVAKAMRQFDPNLTLVAAGSSHMRMKTFGEWERAVLLAAWGDVDQISAHAYYEEHGGDLTSFLASAVHMDRQIKAIGGITDHVKTVLRSEKTITISFDEWNVWYLERELKGEGLYRSEDIAGEEWPVAPRVAEDTYSVADAVVVGNLLMTILKNSNRVGSASLSMLVNSMAPIRAEAGGPAWRQTSFYPYALTAKHARGAVLDLAVSAAAHDTAQYGAVPTVDVVATFDDEAGRIVLLIVNRAESEESELTVDLAGWSATGISDAWTIADADHRATNSPENPLRVTPQPLQTCSVRSETQVAVTVPAVSWSIVVIDGAR